MKTFVLAILFFTFALSPDVPSIHPLKTDIEITSGFGKRMHPIEKVMRHHKGVDFRAAVGTPVYATADGTVASAEFDEGYGNHMVLKHADDYETVYATLEGFDVEVGDQVTLGQQIGRTGNTGVSTKPHLHYEVRKDETPVDPADYFTEK